MGTGGEGFPVAFFEGMEQLRACAKAAAEAEGSDTRALLSNI